MSSKRRIRRNQCGRKVRHADEAARAAQQARLDYRFRTHGLCHALVSFSHRPDRAADGEKNNHIEAPGRQAEPGITSPEVMPPHVFWA